MKASFTIHELKPIIAQLAPVATKGVTPSCEMITFESVGGIVTISANNGLIYYKTEIEPIGAEKDFCCSIQGHKLHKLINSIKEGAITMTVQENFSVKVKSDFGTSTINGEDPKHRLNPKAVTNPDQSFSLLSDTLNNLIVKTIWATKQGDASLKFSVIHIETFDGSIQATSTTGELFSNIKSDESSDRNFNFYIEAQNAMFLLKSLPLNEQITICYDSNCCTFEFGKSVIGFTNPAIDSYIDWRKVLNSLPFDISIDIPGASFASSLNRALIFSDNIKLTFSKDNLHIETFGEEEDHKEDLVINYSGEEFTHAFLASQLLKIIPKSDEFTIKISQERSPMFIEKDGHSTFAMSRFYPKEN